MTDKPAPPDPSRRLFFRQFAGDVLTSAGSVMGAVQSLQQTSAEAAREMLAGEPMAAQGAGQGTVAAAYVPPVESDGRNAGYRAPFRWDGDVCHVVDQRRLPDVLADLEVRGAADAVTAISDGALVGAPVQAQVAAITLALVAGRSSASRAFARRATVRGAANALRQARPGSAPMVAALDRMLALLEHLGLDAEGDVLASALRGEAERIVAEASDDHGALVGHVLASLPGDADAPLRILVAGSTGAMGCGQFGGALSAVMTAHHAGRTVRALVAEGRPGFEGSRIAAWELRQAGVPHAVVTDAAAPGCIAAGEVQAVLVGADRIAANGDVVAPAGTYPLALAAAAAGVPFLVCATTPAVDLTVADGGAAALEEGRPSAVLRAGGTRIALEGTEIRSPLQDRVPARLLTRIVTETGVLHPPYGPALAEAVATASTRRSTSAGYAALLTQRAAASRAAEAAADGDGGDGAGASDGPVDVAALRNKVPGSPPTPGSPPSPGSPPGSTG